MSNHVSWLDLVALGAVQPLRMVAKSEVRAWPVIGPLARRAGTVFVDRQRLAGAGTATVASFVGSATLWDAAVLVAGVRGLVVEVQLLPLLPADGSDRRALAAGAQAAVTAATLPPAASVPVWAQPTLRAA